MTYHTGDLVEHVRRRVFKQMGFKERCSIFLRRVSCCCGHPEYQPLSSDVGSTCSLPDAVQISCLSEQLTERVAEHIGKGYEAVGIRLGLPKVFIERCKMSHSSHHMQVFHMLYTWRQTAGTQATVRVLMDVLEDSVYVCDVDMEAIVRLLKKLE